MLSTATPEWATDSRRVLLVPLLQGEDQLECCGRQLDDQDHPACAGLGRQAHRGALCSCYAVLMLCTLACVLLSGRRLKDQDHPARAGLSVKLTKVSIPLRSSGPCVSSRCAVLMLCTWARAWT